MVQARLLKLGEVSWLGHHTEYFDLEGKRNGAETDGVSAWVDPEGYRCFVSGKKRAALDGLIGHCERNHRSMVERLKKVDATRTSSRDHDYRRAGVLRTSHAKGKPRSRQAYAASHVRGKRFSSAKPLPS